MALLMVLATIAAFWEWSQQCIDSILEGGMRKVRGLTARAHVVGLVLLLESH